MACGSTDQPEYLDAKKVPPDLARSAFDAAPDAMIIIDASRIARFKNRLVSSVFGYEHDEDNRQG
jgi:PAS domain-containing protein